MIIKSKDHEGNILELQKFFKRLRLFKMRLNPHKCVFGVTKGKVLGFIVSRGEIKVDPAKVNDI